MAYAEGCFEAALAAVRRQRRELATHVMAEVRPSQAPGSFARVPHAHDSITFTDSVALSVKLPDDVRPWEEMWQVVEYALASLEDRYASYDNPFDFGLLRNDALIFFLSCHHLGDHIWSDPQVPLDEAEVRAYIAANEELGLVEDFSNSFKHHTRRNARMRLVRVDGYDSHPRAMWIGWADGGGVRHRREALDLARGAVAGWRGVLRAKGLV